MIEYTDEYYAPAYKGSKQFKQQDVKTAGATGFTAAADDYMERGIDLNEQLIKNKPATFFFRMTGDAMAGAGIFNGDVLVVDRSIKIANGKIVVAIWNGEMLVRRLETSINKIRLLAESPRISPVEVDAQSEFNVWGVVTYNIHAL